MFNGFPHHLFPETLHPLTIHTSRKSKLRGDDSISQLCAKGPKTTRRENN